MHAVARKSIAAPPLRRIPTRVAQLKSETPALVPLLASSCIMTRLSLKMLRSELPPRGFFHLRQRGNHELGNHEQRQEEGCTQHSTEGEA